MRATLSPDRAGRVECRDRDNGLPVGYAVMSPGMHPGPGQPSWATIGDTFAFRQPPLPHLARESDLQLPFGQTATAVLVGLSARKSRHPAAGE